MLLKQSPTEIDSIVKLFYLSSGEKEYLLSSGVGEGLFFAGLNHVAMKVLAAPFEHTVITSNPQEVKQMQDQAALNQTARFAEAPARRAAQPQPTSNPESNPPVFQPQENNKPIP